MSIMKPSSGDTKMSTDEATTRTEEAAEEISYPPRVLVIARRTKYNHYFLPTQDTTFCGMLCKKVMVDSGCNTVLLPFPTEANRQTFLSQLNEPGYDWVIAWSGGTGAFHCPALKIFPPGDSVGNMKFGVTGYEKAMPFLRFHLGSNEALWLLGHPMKLSPVDLDSLQKFLQSIGSREVLGRTTAIIGQMLMKHLCVVQMGKVMFMFDPRDEDINVLRVGDACNNATKGLVREFDGFLDLHETDNDFFDEDGVIPEED